MIADKRIEVVARAIAKADGLNWDEPCGLESDQDECNSGTCVAALCEDHDPDWSRAMYLQHARAAIAAMQGERDAIVHWLAEDAAKCDDELRKLHAGKKLTPRMTIEWEAMIAAKSGIAAAIARGEHLKGSSAPEVSRG